MTQSRREWLLLGVMCVALVRTGVDAQQLPSLYWNLTGNTFSAASPVTLTVPLSSSIDIVCPFYSNPANSYEYYAIYRVSQASYNACYLYQSTSDNTPQVFINCSAPSVQRTATIAFLLYSSVPNSVDFQVGQTYYYISTSSGTLSGLSQNRNGVCSTNNMRVAFTVVNTTSVTVATVTQASTSQNSSQFGLSPSPLLSSALSITCSVVQQVILLLTAATLALRYFK